MANTLIREITSHEDPAFLDAMELYVESFPREEREPVSQFAKRCDPLASRHREWSNRSHLIVVEKGSRVVGMRFCVFAPESSYGFFVYIVVDKAHRKEGIGSRLLEYSLALLRLDALSFGTNLKAVFFECERMCDAKSPQEAIVRTARLDYFQKRSGQVVSGTYVQPALTDDLSPLPLNLMAYQFDSQLNRKEMVIGFYKHFLGIGSDDPLVIKALIGANDEKPR